MEMNEYLVSRVKMKIINFCSNKCYEVFNGLEGKIQVRRANKRRNAFECVNCRSPIIIKVRERKKYKLNA